MCQKERSKYRKRKEENIKKAEIENYSQEIVESFAIYKSKKSTEIKCCKCCNCSIYCSAAYESSNYRNLRMIYFLVPDRLYSRSEPHYSKDCVF